MKLLLVTLTAVLSICNTKAQTTTDIQVSTAVLTSFSASFKNACEVQWKDADNYYKADFVMNGQYVSAFYDTDGRLIAVTRNISSLQLPITLQTNLKKSYEAHWISDLFEYSDENGVAYYVTVENGDVKITLKSVGSEWSVFKKQRKS